MFHCRQLSHDRPPISPLTPYNHCSLCFIYMLITYTVYCHTQDQLSGSRCLCPPGFSGKFCQNSPSPCDSAPCLHGGQCVEKDGQTVACSCPMGYSGSFCEVRQPSLIPTYCDETRLTDLSSPSSVIMKRNKGGTVTYNYTKY